MKIGTGNITVGFIPGLSVMHGRQNQLGLTDIKRSDEKPGKTHKPEKEKTFNHRSFQFFIK